MSIIKNNQDNQDNLDKKNIDKKKIDKKTQNTVTIEGLANPPTKNQWSVDKIKDTLEDMLPDLKNFGIYTVVNIIIVYIIWKFGSHVIWFNSIPRTLLKAIYPPGYEYVKDILRENMKKQDCHNVIETGGMRRITAVYFPDQISLFNERKTCCKNLQPPYKSGDPMEMPCWPLSTDSDTVKSLDDEDDNYLVYNKDYTDCISYDVWKYQKKADAQTAKTNAAQAERGAAAAAKGGGQHGGAGTDAAGTGDGDEQEVEAMTTPVPTPTSAAVPRPSGVGITVPANETSALQAVTEGVAVSRGRTREDVEAVRSLEQIAAARKITEPVFSSQLQVLERQGAKQRENEQKQISAIAMKEQDHSYNLEKTRRHDEVAEAKAERQQKFKETMKEKKFQAKLDLEKKKSIDDQNKKSGDSKLAAAGAGAAAAAAWLWDGLKYFISLVPRFFMGFIKWTAGCSWDQGWKAWVLGPNTGTSLLANYSLAVKSSISWAIYNCLNMASGNIIMGFLICTVLLVIMIGLLLMAWISPLSTVWTLLDFAWPPPMKWVSFIAIPFLLAINTLIFGGMFFFFSIWYVAQFWFSCLFSKDGDAFKSQLRGCTNIQSSLRRLFFLLTIINAFQNLPSQVIVGMILFLLFIEYKSS